MQDSPRSLHPYALSKQGEQSWLRRATATFEEAVVFFLAGVATSRAGIPRNSESSDVRVIGTPTRNTEERN